jgi:hypothetical protein
LLCGNAHRGYHTDTGASGEADEPRAYARGPKFVGLVGLARGSTNRCHVMTQPESEEVRASALLTACGLGAVALAAVAVMLVVGLKRTTDGVVVSRLAPARSTPPARPDVRRRSTAFPAAHGRLFARSSVWNKLLPATTPVDPNSWSLVQVFVAEVERERTAGIGPWFAATEGSTPLYRVGAAQRRVRVRLHTPNPDGRTALRRAFAAVPIPPDAKPAVPPDRHMTVWQPSTDKLWEFFGARRRSHRWHADWGGAIRRVSKSPGYYTEAAWPGAKRSWGATASSLPVIGGTVLLDELKSGRIKHALALNVPAARAGVFAWPAQRTDGVGPSTALPEGARLRLDPALDLADLKLPKVTRMIAEAAQRYGLVVRDQTGNGISLFGENPSQFSGNPYRRYFKGRTSQQLLANFPWDRLQVLDMHLCTTAPCELP